MDFPGGPYCFADCPKDLKVANAWPVDTPPQSNLESENHWVWDEHSLPQADSQGPC